MYNRNLRIALSYKKKTFRYIAATAISFLLFILIPLSIWENNKMPLIPTAMFCIGGGFLCVLFGLGAIRSQKYMMLYYHRHNLITKNKTQKIDLQKELILNSIPICNGLNKFIGADDERNNRTFHSNEPN